VRGDGNRKGTTTIAERTVGGVARVAGNAGVFQSSIRISTSHASVNWGRIHFEDLDLDCLGIPFSEDEVREGVFQMPKYKPLGRMGSPVPTSRDVGKPSKRI
jgi:hypothetical protein